MAVKTTMVPHLTTALTGPLQRLEQCFLDHQAGIEAWFEQQWAQVNPPFYCSVDLRNAGFKLAPVDTNLFPAGFNNLNKTFLPLCSQAISDTLLHLIPTAKKVLLIPEAHTRNAYYLDNLAALCQMISDAGFETRIGWLDENPPTEMATTKGTPLKVSPVTCENNALKLANFEPDVIVLNNDLSSGTPMIFEGLSQPIFPSIAMGWTSRLKSSHFSRYNAVAHEFTEQIGLDPWLINPLFRNCGKIDFMKRSGEDCLVKNAGLLLKAIQTKYDEYGIKEKPFVMVKADAGTYGMGVMPIFDANDLRGLNRKQRTHMSAAKGGRTVTAAIIQEGIYSFETWPDSQNELTEEEGVAEPVVYMIGHHVVGGFYRVHKRRGPNENLNSPGMYFEPLAFANVGDHPLTSEERRHANTKNPNRFYAYGVVARLALLAAAKENHLNIMG